jgi:hypothetical protein
MARRSNKSIAKILTPRIQSPIGELLWSPKNDDDLLVLERKITIATEDFITSKFCELILRDRTEYRKKMR